MNQVTNSFSPFMNQITRVPMRHTFTMEQKMILIKSFDEGMIGQSLAYHDKIAQCAQESGLDFDTVKNWVGNQRRKRRMEEMQMFGGQDPQLSPLSTQIPFKYQRTVDGHSGQQRQVQLLYFPRSSDGPVNLPNKLMDTTGPPMAPRVQYSTQNSHSPPMSRLMPRGAPMHQLHHALPGIRRQQRSSFTYGPTRTLQPQMVTSQGMPIPRQPHPAQMATSHRLTNGPRFLPDHGTRFVEQESQSDSVNVWPTTVSGGSQGQPGPHSQDPGQPVSQGPDDGDSPGVNQISMSRSENLSDGGSLQYTNSTSRQPQDLGMERGYDSTPASMVDSNWRDLQIQKIIETIQIYVDQLNKLGCEAFLASVSKDTLSTFLCGTPMGNSYFTEVNEERPLSEYIEGKMMSHGQDEEQRDETPAVDFEPENSTEPQESEMGTEFGNEGEAEVRIEISSEGNVAAVSTRDDHESTGQMLGDQMGKHAEEEVKEDKVVFEVTTDDSGETHHEKDQGKIIRSGEEVYIVNKKHFIIGRGTLLPAPHEKITLQNIHVLDDGHSINDDGFVEEERS